MGFFSQDCESCGHPALCAQATTEGVNEWMTQVVALLPDGSVHMGAYNGYGTVGTADDVIGFEAQVWHRACWVAAGQPLTWTKASTHSADQGWFFDDGDHDMLEPGVEECA